MAFAPASAHRFLVWNYSEL